MKLIKLKHYLCLSLLLGLVSISTLYAGPEPLITKLCNEADIDQLCCSEPPTFNTLDSAMFFEDDIAKYLPNVNKYIKDLKGKEESLDSAYTGSSRYQSCQLFTSKKWDELSKETDGANISDSFKISWVKHAEEHRDAMKQLISIDYKPPFKDYLTGIKTLKTEITTCSSEIKAAEGDATKIKAAIAKVRAESISELVRFEKDVKVQRANIMNSLKEMYADSTEHLRKIRSCMAMATMTNLVDYEADYVTGGQTKATSFDKKINCTSTGAEPQDFPACKKAVTIYNGAVIAQKGVETFQTIKNQDDLQDLQFEYAKNANSATAALTAQKEGVENQEKIAKQRAVFHGAKVAALIAAYAAFPDGKKLVSGCSIDENAGTPEFIAYGKIQKKYHKLLMGEESDFEEPNPVDKDTVCKTALMEYRLLANQEQKSILQQLMAEAGIDAIANAYQSSLLGKQADRLQDAINNVDDFRPEELSGANYAEVMLKYCQKYPTSKKCLDMGYNPQTGFPDGGFSFSGGTGASTTIGGEEDIVEAVADSSDNDATNEAISGLGTLGDDGILKPTGFESGSPAAAQEVAAQSGGGGGGSGGGGGGGLASGDGSGVAPTGGGRSLAATSKKTKYSGGSSSRYRGGSKKRKSSKSSKNPFANLFKKKGLKNGDLKFAKRGIASKSGKSIWDLLSNRYKVTHQNKRLLEYVPADKE